MYFAGMQVVICECSIQNIDIPNMVGDITKGLKIIAHLSHDKETH